MTDCSIDCSICLEKIKKGSEAVRCGHVFHKKCIDIWKRTSNTCPLCRTTINENLVDLVNIGDVGITGSTGYIGNTGPVGYISDLENTGHVGLTGSTGYVEPHWNSSRGDDYRPPISLNISLQFFFNSDPRVAYPVVAIPVPSDIPPIEQVPDLGSFFRIVIRDSNEPNSRVRRTRNRKNA